MDPIESPFTETQLAEFMERAIPLTLLEAPNTFLGAMIATIRIMDWVLEYVV